MAEPPFFSSQDSHYPEQEICLHQEVASSPEIPRGEHSSVLKSEKPRKPPTVTPKRFTKFFTPRNSLSTRNRTKSKAGRQLRDITKNGTNRQKHKQPPTDVDLGEDDLLRPIKRRKFSRELSSSPPQSSPLKHVQTAEQIQLFEDVPTSPVLSDSDTLGELDGSFQPHPKRIQRINTTTYAQRVLHRSFGHYDAPTPNRRNYDHCVDWRTQTANFVTLPDDAHLFSGAALPFCSASCNTNSLLVIGEEEGGVRLIDSSPSADFSKPHVAFRPHSNAIMDLSLSSDDFMLVTAAGDQTARITDMTTQTTFCTLSGHKSSVKQVRFRPNDDNLITTSSRDGTVMIWDLRCGGQASVQSLRSSSVTNVDTGGVEPAVRFARHILEVGATFRAKDTTLHNSASRYNDPSSVSITSIQHLSQGREHLLLTSSEVSASIKLWDLRNAARRGGLCVPLSSTPTPTSHARSRNYGINTMVLSGDSSRLFASCRDSAVYAYSTDHLVLGFAPEMSSTPGKARMLKISKAGIGPLYAYRHPDFRAGSFYVRAALRPASGDKSEMLAVGSSNGTPVLFPTDERYLPRRNISGDPEHDYDDGDMSELPSLPRAGSQALSHRSDIQSYEHGTVLVRAHQKEVTSVVWTHDGDLVTIGDDFTARCWREDSAKARELRACGENGGRRWACGWAEVNADWDEDDG